MYSAKEDAGFVFYGLTEVDYATIYGALLQYRLSLRQLQKVHRIVVGRSKSVSDSVKSCDECIALMDRVRNEVKKNG